MLTFAEARGELLRLLREKSVFHGEFTLASGAKSNVYVDCRLTTFDGHGAWLVGQCMHHLISTEASRRDLRVAAVGGLTMGADPVALATAMTSFLSGDTPPLKAFSVRKAPKAHGQTKLVEGNFASGDTVVVIDDVITRGESTINAVQAIQGAGGKIAFSACMVDRQEGGREKVEALGFPVIALFTRKDIFE